jgi:hypothetical protein
MRFGIVGESRGDEQVAPVGLSESNALAHLHQVALRQLQYREANALEPLRRGRFEER